MGNDLKQTVQSQNSPGVIEGEPLEYSSIVKSITGTQSNKTAFYLLKKDPQLTEDSCSKGLKKLQKEESHSLVMFMQCCACMLTSRFLLKSSKFMENMNSTHERTDFNAYTHSTA